MLRKINCTRESSPRATAIWIPGTVGSMHQCLPWLPLWVSLHLLHATALRVSYGEVLRACCSTMPISHKLPNSQSIVWVSLQGQQSDVLGMQCIMVPWSNADREEHQYKRSGASLRKMPHKVKAGDHLGNPGGHGEDMCNVPGSVKEQEHAF